MIDPETGTPAVAQAWNLCDDLGQIEYIFSDKTGTLTCNVMELRKCSINGVVYGNSFISQANIGSAKRAGESNYESDSNYEKLRLKEESTMRKNMENLFDTKYISEDPLSFVDTRLHEHIEQGSERIDADLEADEFTDQATCCIQFFTLLAVCHSVLIDEVDPAQPYKLNYTAQSPDEAALVAAARDNGFTFVAREKSEVSIDVLGVPKTFEVLNVLEFNSDRKRMSVIVRMPQSSTHVVLFCKGADSVIFERLAEEGTSAELLQATSSHLEMFANDGLRTLSLAYRIIPIDEYEEWVVNYTAAKADTSEKRDELVDAATALIETNMKLMGATAIEDKLQDGVPDAIELLSTAGIKLWVLTVSCH